MGLLDLALPTAFLAMLAFDPASVKPRLFSTVLVIRSVPADRLLNLFWPNCSGWIRRKLHRLMQKLAQLENAALLPAIGIVDALLAAAT